MQLWQHQSRALDQARAAVQSGHRRILIVSPTGSGKGTLGAEILRSAVSQGHRGLFIVHRREIILDQQQRLTKLGVRAGVIMADHNASPYAPVQVASTTTLLNRDTLPPAQVVFIDEIHHYAQNQFSRLIDAYPDAVIVGATATPERGDGRPLSQFQHMIVAAQYSELISAGLIVPALVYAPAENMGSNLAVDPVAAYLKYALGTKGFTFISSLELGEDVAKRFCQAGVPAKLITGKTPKHERDRAVSDLNAGRLLMLVNFNVFSEGTDVPSAQTCVLGSACNHCGTYLQRVGRVLRAHPGKKHAIVVDLVGAYHRHNLPHIDREYSLTGRAIGASNLPPLTVCPACGLTQLSGRTACEGCGFQFIRKDRKLPYIGNEQLRAVFDWEHTPVENRLDYFLDVVDECFDKSYTLDWAIKQYQTLFQSEPPIEWLAGLPHVVKKTAFETWRQKAEQAGWKKGYAYARYRQIFGSSYMSS